MDGFVFTFLPVLFKIGVGVGLPLLGLCKLVPVTMRAWTRRLFARHKVEELEQYSERANALVCRLLVEGVITSESKEDLYALQASYTSRKSLTR